MSQGHSTLLQAAAMIPASCLPAPGPELLQLLKFLWKQWVQLVREAQRLLGGLRAAGGEDLRRPEKSHAGVAPSHLPRDGAARTAARPIGTGEPSTRAFGQRPLRPQLSDRCASQGRRAASVQLLSYCYWSLLQMVQTSNRRNSVQTEPPSRSISVEQLHEDMILVLYNSPA